MNITNLLTVFSESNKQSIKDNDFYEYTFVELSVFNTGVVVNLTFTNDITAEEADGFNNILVYTNDLINEL